jgi:hypothetical protein
MRLIALLLTGFLAATPLGAQQAETSSPAASSSSNGEPKNGSALPVSLDKIREGLDRPASSSQLLKAMDKLEKPDFKVEVREKQKIEELISTLDFKAGPTPAGGIYAFEQQRMLTPSVDNPLAQPYAAFSQGQLTTILVENLVGKYLAGKAADAISKTQRESAEATARREVEEAIAEYCGSKPNNGVGIPLCTSSPHTAQ